MPYSSWPARKNIFLHKKVSMQGILDNINEQDTSFLDYKHKHMMKRGTPLVKSNEKAQIYRFELSNTVVIL